MNIKKNYIFVIIITSIIVVFLSFFLIDRSFSNEKNICSHPKFDNKIYNKILLSFSLKKVDLIFVSSIDSYKENLSLCNTLEASDFKIIEKYIFEKSNEEITLFGQKQKIFGAGSGFEISLLNLSDTKIAIVFLHENQENLALKVPNILEDKNLD